MKICPNCSFANDEGQPTCAFCDALIVDVRSTPSADHNHPEHAKRLVTERRHKIIRKQVIWAMACYSTVIVVTAACPGLVLDPLGLLLFLASSIIATMAADRNITGPFSTSLLQGLLSVVLLIFFAPLQPFIVFVIAAHLCLPILW